MKQCITLPRPADMARGGSCACWCLCSAGAAPGQICGTCLNGNHILPPKD